MYWSYAIDGLRPGFVGRVPGYKKQDRAEPLPIVKLNVCVGAGAGAGGGGRWITCLRMRVVVMSTIQIDAFLHFCAL